MRCSSLIAAAMLCFTVHAGDRGEDLGKALRDQHQSIDQSQAERPPWLDPSRAEPLTWRPQAPRPVHAGDSASLRSPGRAGQGDGLYVLISLGMPATVLRSYLRQAEHHDGPVIFVVRGVVDGKIPNLIQALHDVAGHFRFKVQIDPQPFREHGVEQVPVFLGRDAQGIWRRVDGEVSLVGAAEHIGFGGSNAPLGPTHPVTEPDMLEVIEQRIVEADWDALKRDAIARMEAKATQTQLIDPPIADRDHDYWVDLSVSLTRDITLPDGRLVATAGTRVNPLDQIRLSRRYIVFDATDARQRAQVRQWLDQRNGVTLITTRMPADRQGREQVGDELGDHVYLANQFLLHRFDIRAVPALVQQDGNQLRVSVRALRNQSGLDADG